MALTWIYLLRDNDTGYFKIGRSIDPLSRLKTLKKQDTLQPKPNDFVFVEAWWVDEKTEKYLHDRFYEHRRRGEWFDLGPDEIALIHRHLDTFQPFTAAHRPGSLEKELRDARNEVSRLRHDLQVVNYKFTSYMQMVQKRDAGRDQEIAELKALAHPTELKDQPRPHFIKLLEETSLAHRRKS